MCGGLLAMCTLPGRGCLLCLWPASEWPPVAVPPALGLHDQLARYVLLRFCCRQVIADAVLADPFEWNEAVLGKVSAVHALVVCGPAWKPNALAGAQA